MVVSVSRTVRVLVVWVVGARYYGVVMMKGMLSLPVVVVLSSLKLCMCSWQPFGGRPSKAILPCALSGRYLVLTFLTWHLKVPWRGEVKLSIVKLSESRCLSGVRCSDGGLLDAGIMTPWLLTVRWASVSPVGLAVGWMVVGLNRPSLWMLLKVR